VKGDLVPSRFGSYQGVWVQNWVQGAALLPPL
jgi:hypothetical protein